MPTALLAADSIYVHYMISRVVYRSNSSGNVFNFFFEYPEHALYKLTRATLKEKKKHIGRMKRHEKF